MFDADISQLLDPTFLFGFVGGIVVTAFATSFFTSVWYDIKNAALVRWEKLSCATIAAFIVAIAWGVYNGGVVWNEVPGNVIAYAMLSGFVYENVLKPWQARRNGNGGS